MRAIDDCVKKAHESNRLALAIIGSTARHNNPPFIIGPARESQTFVACFYIVPEREHVKAICEYADGKVDYIFIDAEAKNAESGDFLTVAKACVLQSEIKAYKGNDITSLACDLLINELVPELKQKKVSIIGAGNLGSKLALTLAERGADVYISRRDQQGAIIAQALNAILPRYSTGRIYNENNIAESVKNADILIGFTQRLPVIDEAAVTTLAKHALIVDGGIGTVKEAAIATAKRLAITIIRLDVRIAFSYVIDAMLNTEYFMRHIAGTRVIDGKSYVAGGMIGEKNDIVVADIRKPSEIVGIADGKGGMLPPASS